jgi:predicted AlkP superfamily phosphohydrolase/phosphomutase
MKILVINLDGADPEILFGDERLTILCRLMEFGCFGHLETTAMAAGEIAIWDQVAREIERGTLICAPQSYLTSISENARFVDNCPAGGAEGGSGQRDISQHDLYAMSRGQFDVMRRALQDCEWDYFHFIGTGLDDLQLAYDQRTNREQGGACFDFYYYLDQEIGKVLEVLDDDTVILILSGGAERVRGQATSSQGAFILVAPNNPLNGEVKGAHILDIAPTLLELGGYDVPSTMQGKSLVAGKILEPDSRELSEDDESAIRERLSGLGYIL